MNKTDKYVKKMQGKCFDIEAGLMVALVNEADAKEMGIFPLDRIEIVNPRNKKGIITVVDITEKMVGVGEIGIYEEVGAVLKLACPQELEIRAVERPESVAFIKKKLDGNKLTEDEIKAIVEDIAANKISAIEASSFMSAVYIHGFDLDETVAMTKALIENGKQLKIEKQPVLDKHCIGGTNGRATMIVVPILAAAGYYIAKTSSRSITSSAGTADSMEVLAPVSLSIEKIKEITESIGGVIAWGGAVELAPADDKIIKIEHPLSLDPEGQVIASVMAKKASVGAKFLVIDLPVGPDVKVKTNERAESMARKFIEVGKRLGIRVEVLLTDGTEPMGKAFGPAIEAKYVLEILEGKFFDNLAQKSCELAGTLIDMVEGVKKKSGVKTAKKILTSGKALEKMKEIIKAQGGNVLNSEQIHFGKYKQTVVADADGEISKVNVRLLNRIARIAGAPADKKAGVCLTSEEGQKIKKKQTLFEIYAENERKAELAAEFAKKHPVVELEKVVIGKFV